MIDILTQYDFKKKSEHAFKTLMYAATTSSKAEKRNSAVSAQPPTHYRGK